MPFHMVCHWELEQEQFNAPIHALTCAAPEGERGLQDHEAPMSGSGSQKGRADAGKQGVSERCMVHLPARIQLQPVQSS